MITSTNSYSKVPGQPENSYVSGNNWYCHDGYEKSGNQCISIFVKMGGQPENSYVSGNNWYCHDGYEKSGNQCISIFAKIMKSNNVKINIFSPSINDLPSTFRLLNQY